MVRGGSENPLRCMYRFDRERKKNETCLLLMCHINAYTFDRTY
jgi:hypothetical protein